MPAALAGPNHGPNLQHNVNLPSNEECGIRDVWKHNLEDEFRTIRQVVQKYHYVAMDTEFPGVVARPVGEFRSTADYHYQLLRCNVDLLRIIQLGLTFMDEDGKTPPGYSTWQFNFKFNLSEDMYAQDSIDLLQNSGIQFKKHEEDGIDPLDFAELLMSSGIVLVENIKWLCFHSGYDFGYLLKLLTDQNLPAEESDFFDLLRLYFPNIYDIKYLMKSCKNLKGGLQEVADQLELRRVGPQHQAGSDALLTGMAFFKMREVHYDKHIPIPPTSTFLDYTVEFNIGSKDIDGNIAYSDITEESACTSIFGNIVGGKNVFCPNMYGNIIIFNNLLQSHVMNASSNILTVSVVNKAETTTNMITLNSIMQNIHNAVQIHTSILLKLELHSLYFALSDNSGYNMIMLGDWTFGNNDFEDIDDSEQDIESIAEISQMAGNTLYEFSGGRYHRLGDSDQENDEDVEYDLDGDIVMKDVSGYNQDVIDTSASFNSDSSMGDTIFITINQATNPDFTADGVNMNDDLFNNTTVFTNGNVIINGNLNIMNNVNTNDETYENDYTNDNVNNTNAKTSSEDDFINMDHTNTADNIGSFIVNGSFIANANIITAGNVITHSNIITNGNVVINGTIVSSSDLPLNGNIIFTDGNVINTSGYVINIIYNVIHANHVSINGNNMNAGDGGVIINNITTNVNLNNPFGANSADDSHNFNDVEGNNAYNANGSYARYENTNDNNSTDASFNDNYTTGRNSYMGRCENANDNKIKNNHIDDNIISVKGTFGNFVIDSKTKRLGTTIGNNTVDKFNDNNRVLNTAGNNTIVNNTYVNNTIVNNTIVNNTIFNNTIHNNTVVNNTLCNVFGYNGNNNGNTNFGTYLDYTNADVVGYDNTSDEIPTDNIIDIDNNTSDSNTDSIKTADSYVTDDNNSSYNSAIENISDDGNYNYSITNDNILLPEITLNRHRNSSDSDISDGNYVDTHENVTSIDDSIFAHNGNVVISNDVIITFRDNVVNIQHMVGSGQTTTTTMVSTGVTANTTDIANAANTANTSITTIPVTHLLIDFMDTVTNIGDNVQQHLTIATRVNNHNNNNRNISNTGNIAAIQVHVRDDEYIPVNTDQDFGVNSDEFSFMDNVD